MFVEQHAKSTDLAALGADPLEVSESNFRKLLSSRRTQIKALLLNQSAFRGMGNIYTDESLWRARIHPTRLASSLKPDEAGRLFTAMQKILLQAIESKGSSVSDYVDAEGQPGSFQLRHRVYQRTGKKCSRCGSTIRHSIVAGRSTHFCPRCQRAPRARKRAPRNLRKRSR
jgi:formamidopyrimidine-DNA glycosylase